MKKNLLMLAVMLGLAMVALADPTGILLDTGSRMELTDCQAGGGDGGSVGAGFLPVGTYLMRVTAGDGTLCTHNYLAAVPGCGADGGVCWKCASGGEKFPQGTVMLYTVPQGGSGFSCRSDAGTAQFVFTRAR